MKEESAFEDKCNFDDFIKVKAERNNVNKVIDFIESKLTRNKIGFDLISKISVCVDELFSNICFYAYPNKDGDCEVMLNIDNSNISITFIDSGIPFDPTRRKDPTFIKEKEDKRGIGGLGIFIVRKTMDDMNYVRKDNKNILTIIKKNPFCK